MLTAICGVLGNGIKESKHGKSVGQSILSFLFNFGVQVSFVDYSLMINPTHDLLICLT